MTDDGLKCVAELKQEAIKKQKLEEELHDLKLQLRDKTTDSIYQDSVLNRIGEVKKELGIEPEE